MPPVKRNCAQSRAEEVACNADVCVDNIKAAELATSKMSHYYGIASTTPPVLRNFLRTRWLRRSLIAQGISIRTVMTVIILIVIVT
jgi:hypothetical protein